MDPVAAAGEIRMTSASYRPQRSKRIAGKLFEWLCLASTFVCLAALVIMIAGILYRGAAHLDLEFLSGLPSLSAESAGIRVALVGSTYLILLTAFFSIPIAVATAIYLEEYATDSWWVRLVRTNIANLAGVPSIVYGILGMGLFARGLHLGRSLLAGSLTLSLLILPVIIIAAQESLRAVPDSLRRASYALGATKWQTVRYQVLPVALPGIMTGVILSLSRALGEAAPLMAVGAVTYIAFVPESVLDSFTALPIQIYNWSSHPKEEFRDLAATAIMVLLGLLFCMNAIAVSIRHRFARQL
jgi:phosphate transport system permease protein